MSGAHDPSPSPYNPHEDLPDNLEGEVIFDLVDPDDLGPGGNNLA
jgi:hypothetical protein